MCLLLGFGIFDIGGGRVLFGAHPLEQDAGSGQLRSDVSGLTSPWQWAITGMGININQTAFPDNIRNAVSLKQITGKDWQVVELAKDLCTHVQNRYLQLLAGKNILEEFVNNSILPRETIVIIEKV